MATTITSVQDIGTNAWQYEYTGTAPFEILDEGRVKLSQTDRLIYSVQNSDDEEPPVLEIFDSTEDSATAQGKLHPPFGRVQFRGNLQATGQGAYYKLEKRVGGGSWETVEKIIHRGKRYYYYDTETLTDIQTHEIRITPIDSQANEGPPLYFDIDMVRNPPAPSISTSYDSGTGLLTVSSR